jgi:histidine triad (HIT) family protein
MPTIFQRIISGEIPADIVYEDEHCLSFRDINPQAPVHVLIIPKALIPRIGEATEADRDTLGHLLVAVGKVAEKLGVRSTDTGFRIVMNHGQDGGETVPHLHIHLLAGRPLAWPPG